VNRYRENNSENFWEILSQKILLTLGILIFIRMGSFFPIPGINLISESAVPNNFITLFSSDGTLIIGLFTLNIVPYINASIVLQVIMGLGLSPYLEEVKKEADMASRRIIESRIRSFTFYFSLVQSLIFAAFLKPALFDWNLTFVFEMSMWLTTGSMIILWLSQLITDYGIGNGPSLLVYINIISNFPNLYKKIIDANIENLNFQSILIIFLLLFVSLCGIVFLQESFQKIPLLSARELNQSVSNYLTRPENYLPLNLNQAGVIPLIFTTAILVSPIYIANWGLFSFIKVPSVIINLVAIIISKITPFLNILYWYFYFVLVAKSSAFYSTLILKPGDIAEQLQKMAVIIPGIRPGRETTFYLKEQIKRNSQLSGLFLGLLATLPNLAENIFNISNLNGLSITSLLIMSGVLLDINREVLSIYFVTIYDSIYMDL